jgi:hypothetical protein
LQVLDLARAAGLYDLAANELAHKADGWMELTELQNSRLAFDSLGRTLEQLAHQQRTDEQRTNLLNAAADAYSKYGDVAAELRVLTTLLAEKAPVDKTRFSEVFIASHGDLQLLTSRYPIYADAVVQQLIRRGTFSEVEDALTIRGGSLAAPWTDAYTSLSALYFAEYKSAGAGAFDRVLGARTVRAELTDLQAPNSVALRGATWLYYGGRYGEFLGRSKSAEAWDLMPAPLESAPAASNSYVELGDSLREMNQIEPALREYRAAVELSPTRADVYDRISQTQFDAGFNAEARKNWVEALHLLINAAESASLAPEFVTTARHVISHLDRAGFSSELATEVDRLIVTIGRRRGVYNTTPLVAALLKGTPDIRPRMQQIFNLAPELDFSPVLSEITSGNWLSEQRKNALYRLSIDLVQQKITRSTGDAATVARDQFQQACTNYAAYLLSQNRGQDAWAILSQVGPERRPADLVLKAAALSGHLPEQLTAWREDGAHAPNSDQALATAAELKHSGYADAALAIREFEYQRELQNPNPPASAYLGLADVRLEQLRAEEADALIRVAVMNVGAPFENLPAAEHLLESKGRKQQALAYAREWSQAEPWSGEAKLALATLEGNVTALEAIRSSRQFPYDVRVRAAETLAQLHHAVQGNDELALLTHDRISPEQASRAFYVAARLRAARQTTDNDAKRRLLSAAVANDPALDAPRLELVNAALSSGRLNFGVSALESYRRNAPLSDARPELMQATVNALAMLISRSDFGRAVDLGSGFPATNFAGAERQRLEQLRAEAVAGQQLDSFNSQRQPFIHGELTQPVIVRPKLAHLPAGSEDQ